MESIETIWKSFWILWKVSGQSEKFPDTLKRFWTLWNVSKHSGKFPDNLEKFPHTLVEVLEEPDVPEDLEPGEEANKEVAEDFSQTRNAPEV